MLNVAVGQFNINLRPTLVAHPSQRADEIILVLFRRFLSQAGRL